MEYKYYVLINVNAFFVIILGIKTQNPKSVWDLFLRKEISQRNAPTDAINNNNNRNLDMFSSLVKRTQTSLTPYESVGK